MLSRHPFSNSLKSHCILKQSLMSLIFKAIFISSAYCQTRTELNLLISFIKTKKNNGPKWLTKWETKSLIFTLWDVVVNLIKCLWKIRIFYINLITSFNEMNMMCKVQIFFIKINKCFLWYPLTIDRFICMNSLTIDRFIGISYNL